MAHRPMVAEDDALASEVLCASITQLCAADHHNDPILLKKWLSNKTPEHLLQWQELANSRLLVATSDGNIASVGGYDLAGNITLNYVSPGYRFQGVGKALLTEMESQLAQLGLGSAKLDSTETAHRFYAEAGWQDAGDPDLWNGLVGYPMQKKLG